MVIQANELIFRAKSHNMFGSTDLNVDALRALAEEELDAADKIGHALRTQNLDLPKTAWLGARLIKNGLSILDQRGASGLASYYFLRGLNDYEAGRSKFLEKRLADIMLAAGSGDVETLRSIADELPYTQAELPYPDEILQVEKLGNINSQLEKLETTLGEIESAKITLATLTESGQTIAKKIHDSKESAEATAASLKEIEDRASKMGELITSRIEAVEASYLANHSLKKAAVFWGSESKDHQTSQRRWFWVFIIAVGITIAGAIGLIFKFETIAASSLLKTPNTWSLVLILFGVPIGVWLWMVRLFSRMHRHEIALRDDTKERKLMTEAYISMLATEDIQPDDRGHVLRSIFRPRTVEDIEDGPPTIVAQLAEGFRDGRAGTK